MKRFLLLPLVMASVFVAACDVQDSADVQAPVVSDVAFRVGVSTPQLNKTTSTAGSKATRADVSQCSYILVSVSDANSNAVVTNKELKLYSFGGEYLSEAVSLASGQYTVTDFVVLDSNRNVRYVAPKEGSAKASLVSDPLPLPFAVTRGETTTVTPEVIAAAEGSPADYGYATFDFAVVDTFVIMVDVMMPGAASFEKTAAHAVVYGSKSTEANAKIMFSGDITPEANHIQLNAGYDKYVVEVTKAGYTPVQKEFSEAEIRAFSATAYVVTLSPVGLAPVFQTEVGTVSVKIDAEGNEFAIFSVPMTMSGGYNGLPINKPIRYTVIGDMIDEVKAHNGEKIALEGFFSTPFGGTVDVARILSLSDYGLVSIQTDERTGKSSVIITRNWESSSPIQYMVSGELVEEIKALAGKLVLVRGLYRIYEPGCGEVLVQKILDVKDVE